MSTYILLFFNVFLAVSGQLLLKYGMNKIGELEFSISNVSVLFLAAIKNIYIWIALMCYGLGMVLWLFVLSKLKLSLAYPATTLIYVFVIAGSWFILKEKITAMQLVGITMMLIGMFFLFKDNVVLN